MFGPSFLLLAGAAMAYETDNLTDRHLPLEDATPLLDDRVNELIALAIARTNEKTGCSASEDRTHRTFAKVLRRETATDELVTQYKGIASLGYDRFAAWIVTGGAPHREFTDRRDIFGDIKAGESPILKWAGVGSSVRIGEYIVGVDKLDHFFEEGHESWQRSDYGERPEKGVAWATRTENTIYGLETSQTFSFGDLKADHDGMIFYDTLLDPDAGVAAIGDDGCLVATNRFSWAGRVTWEYDEVLNPPVYTPTAQAAVTRHLEKHRAEYCEGWAAWGGADYLAHLGRVFDAGTPPYASDDAPARRDPYHLDALCAEDATEAVATPSP